MHKSWRLEVYHLWWVVSLRFMWVSRLSATFTGISHGFSYEFLHSSATMILFGHGVYLLLKRKKYRWWFNQLSCLISPTSIWLIFSDHLKDLIKEDHLNHQQWQIPAAFCSSQCHPSIWCQDTLSYKVLTNNIRPLGKKIGLGGI